MWNSHYRTEQCAFWIKVLKDKLRVECFCTSTVLISDTKDVHLDEVVEHCMSKVDFVLVEGLREQVCVVLTKVFVMEAKDPLFIVVTVELTDG